MGINHFYTCNNIKHPIYSLFCFMYINLDMHCNKLLDVQNTVFYGIPSNMKKKCLILKPILLNNWNKISLCLLNRCTALSYTTFLHTFYSKTPSIKQKRHPFLTIWLFAVWNVTFSIFSLSFKIYLIVC